MLKTLTPLLGALLLAGSTAVSAQAAAQDDKGAREQRVEKMRAARDKAREACQGKAEGERRDCMRREMCAQAKDPAKCEARAKERAERRAKKRQEQTK